MFSVLCSIYANERPAYFRTAMQSIIDQTVPPAEIVLVKDGPLTDELEAVISRLVTDHPSLFKIVGLKSNVGLGLALQAGLSHCTHDIIARVDTDDICTRDRFEKQLHILATRPSIDVVSSWIDEFSDDPSNIISTRRVPEYHPGIVAFAKKRNPINHPAVVFRKESVLKAGGYQHHVFFEDYYLWVRLILSGAVFYNCQESLMYFRTSKDMYKRRGGMKYIRSEIKLQFKFLQMHFITFPQFTQNILYRIFFRIVPNKLRSKLYKTILR